MKIKVKYRFAIHSAQTFDPVGIIPPIRLSNRNYTCVYKTISRFDILLMNHKSIQIDSRVNIAWRYV